MNLLVSLACMAWFTHAHAELVTTHDLPPYDADREHGGLLWANELEGEDGRARRADEAKNYEIYKPENTWFSGEIEPHWHIAEFSGPNGTTRYLHVFVTIVPDPLNQFSIYEPGGEGGCAKTEGIRKRPSETTAKLDAQGRHCIVAGNGGFFNMTTGACLGHVVSDGRVVKISDRKNADFGIQSDGTLVTGYIPPSLANSTENPFKQLVTGVIWIVRNGKAFVDESSKIEDLSVQTTGNTSQFVGTMSARAAVGHDQYGRVVLVQVDGKTDKRGASLYDLAKIMLDFGVLNAINLDGGGSMTSVHDNVVQNIPSDECWNERQYQCERAITTIVCVHDRFCEPDPTCSKHGRCQWGTCECDDGWTGKTCNEEVQSCTNPTGNFCHKNAECVPSGPGIHKCICRHGYYGDGEKCTDIDECQLLVEMSAKGNANGTGAAGGGGGVGGMGAKGDAGAGLGAGVATTGVNATDKDVTRHQDHWSILWELKKPPKEMVLYQTYTNSVHPVPCSVHGRCTNTEGSYTCMCNNGYSGDGLTCVCAEGFTGPTCSQEIDNCHIKGKARCHEFARCIKTGPGKHMCSCLPGFEGNGATCSDIDECSLVPKDDARRDVGVGIGILRKNELMAGEVGVVVGRRQAKGKPANGAAADKTKNGQKAAAAAAGVMMGADAIPASFRCHKQAKCVNVPGSFLCECVDGYVGSGMDCEKVADLANTYLDSWEGVQEHLLPLMIGVAICGSLLFVSLIANVCMAVAVCRKRRRESRYARLGINGEEEEEDGMGESVEALAMQPRGVGNGRGRRREQATPRFTVDQDGDMPSSTTLSAPRLHTTGSSSSLRSNGSGRRPAVMEEDTDEDEEVLLRNNR